MNPLTHENLLLKRQIKYLAVLGLFVVLFACQESGRPSDRGLANTNSKISKGNLTIATAANVQFAMRELIRTFTQETGIKCHMILSSSGKLTAQINAGAPFDVFVSADVKYPQELYENGLTQEPPEIYAYGKLVIWSFNEPIDSSFERLASEKIQHIAIANPKTAPYGAAAVEALKHYGVYQMTKEKLVFGESIAQTNQFIFSQSANLGFTSKSVVLSTSMKGRGYWMEVEEAAYSPLAQGVVVIKRPEANQAEEDAEKFYKFLFSKKAKSILVDFGYQVGD